MGKLADKSYQIFVNMYHLRHCLWIAIAGSMLATVASDPVLAKPLVRAKAMIASQPTTRSTDPDLGSRQPIEAILAKVKLKATMPTKAGQKSVRSLVTAKAIVRTTKNTNNHLDADRSSQGTTTFTNLNPVKNRANNSSALDPWID